MGVPTRQTAATPPVAWPCVLSRLIGLLIALLMSGPEGFAWPDSVLAREIAILKSDDIGAYSKAIEAFRTNLGDVTFTEYNLRGDVRGGERIGGKIRATKPALVLAVGLKAALVAKAHLGGIPVVFCMVLDPLKHGLRTPNMRGITLDIPVEQQFSTLRTVFPRLHRIGVVFDPAHSAPLIEAGRRSARAEGFELVEKPVRTEKQVPAAMRDLLGEAEALWLVPDTTVLTEDSLGFILSTALEQEIPIMGFSSEFVRKGALFSLMVDPSDVGQQAATVAKRILTGVDGRMPSLIPPDHVRLAVNLKTARFLGITIPPDLLHRASEVYKTTNGD